MYSKRLFAGIMLLGILFSGCKKDDKVEDTNIYYFNFKADGEAFAYNSTTPRYESDDANLVGGVQSVDGVPYPAIGLGVLFNHNPDNDEIATLAGKTLYFDGSFPKPVVMFYPDIATNTHYTSIDTLDADFNVKINSISYLRTDSTEDNAIDVFIAKGTCHAYLTNAANTSLHKNISEGDFFFLISSTK